MKLVIERSVFFRTLNYLRVKHPFAARYNIVYPASATLMAGVLLLWLGDASDYFAVGAFIPSLAPVLSILSPFFIAALAAVSTFSGPPSFNAPFSMTSKVTLTVIGDGGAWDVIEVTPRHFLSLLFGYCAVLSLALLVFTLLSPLILKAILLTPLAVQDIVLPALLISFLFLLCQLLLSTLLGIYYLSDKLHRE